MKADDFFLFEMPYFKVRMLDILFKKIDFLLVLPILKLLTAQEEMGTKANILPQELEYYRNTAIKQLSYLLRAWKSISYRLTSHLQIY